MVTYNEIFNDADFNKLHGQDEDLWIPDSVNMWVDSNCLDGKYQRYELLVAPLRQQREVRVAILFTVFS
jgi:hypothetical protein